METQALIDELRSMSRDQFVARHRSTSFLLLTTNVGDDDEAGFNTMVREPGSFKGKSRSQVSRQLTVLPIQKAEGNPYPDRISVGRARNCDVALRDPSVSKLHAHFKVRDGGFDLVDLGSQNGSCVNGRPLAKERPEAVSSGDVLLFGAVSCKIVNAGLLHDLLK
jgi:hypothetical protein